VTDEGQSAYVLTFQMAGGRTAPTRGCPHGILGELAGEIKREQAHLTERSQQHQVGGVRLIESTDDRSGTFRHRKCSVPNSPENVGDLSG